MSDETPDNVTEFDGPPGEEKRIPLVTPGDIQRELAKVYRALRAGRISPQRGNALVQCLFTLSKIRTDAGVESAIRSRLQELPDTALDALLREAKGDAAASHH